MKIQWLLRIQAFAKTQNKDHKAETKTPPELNRSGAFAIAWLPLAGGSIFLYASANPSRKAGALLSFPECALLPFPHRPSAQSSDLFHRSPFMHTNLAGKYAAVNYPRIFGWNIKMFVCILIKSFPNMK